MSSLIIPGAVKDADKLARQAAAKRRWRESHPERYREIKAASDKRQKEKNKALYVGKARGRRKVTRAEYEALLAKQSYACAVCGRDAWENRGGLLFIDHNHATGEVRGLLCSSCNTALGMVEDNTDILHRLIQYLRQPCQS